MKPDLRVVLYATHGCESDPLFRYIHAHVASRYPDTQVLVVRRSAAASGIAGRLRRLRRKIRRFGFGFTLEQAIGYPLQLWLGRRDARAIAQGLARLSRPEVPLDPESLVEVPSVNGAEAVARLRTMDPDVLVQAGAGILRREVFSIPRFGALNMHHGIAPLIRGVDSIYWSLWERRPEWLGVTVHRIDAGIDTGEVLAYAPVEAAPRQRPPALFVRATALGTAAVLDVLERLSRGESWAEPPPAGHGVYRSTFSGVRRLLLPFRLRGRAVSRPGVPSS